MRYKLAGPPTKLVAETFSFRFSPNGWATFTLCEESGELNVRSDWGDSSYHWSFEGRGKVSLKDFLADRTHVGYLVDKLCRGSELEDVYDGKRMAIELRKLIPEYLSKHSTLRASKEVREDLLADIKSFCINLDGKQAKDGSHFWAAMTYHSRIHDLCDGEPWFLTRTRPSAWALVWRDLLLPTFVKHLKKAGYGRAPVEPPTVTNVP